MKRITALDKLYPAPKDGINGNDGVSYSIVCSNTNPNVTNSAAVITLTAYQTVGSKRTKIAMDEHLCFGMDGEYIYDNPMTLTIKKGSTTTKEVELIGEDNNNPLAICSISPVVNGVNGTSVSAQYCPGMARAVGENLEPDTSKIHSTFQSGDIFMRTSNNGGTSWSSWVRIVGEDGADGEYTDYTFNLSKDKSIANAYTSPGNLINNSWTDAPKVPTSAYPYLWMRMQQKNLPAGTAVVSGREYTYVRLTGEDGKDGKTVTAQYSQTSTGSWHTPFAAGDLWMRTSEDGGNTWGAAVRIVGEKGDGGAWTDYSFNISSALTTASSTTAPSPLGRSSWQDAPIPTTTSYPYLWMMVQKYSDTNTKDGSARYVRVTGEKGAPGADGGDGNGISSQTSLFLATDKNKLTEYSSADRWSATFPAASITNPYIWKCVKTIYTKKSSPEYSTPELIAVYSSGCNKNLLDNAAFVSADRMDAWYPQSSYAVINGQTAPTDKGYIKTSDKLDGRNSFYDSCKAAGDVIYYKEVLRQTVERISNGIKKLDGSKWYTLSFWAKGWENDFYLNQTSNAYGFATRSCYLYAGWTYDLRLSGSVSNDAQQKGHSLVMFVYNSDWTDSASVMITETSRQYKTGKFTPKNTGIYYISFYMYHEGYKAGDDRTGTVTVNYYSINDNRDLTIHFYPGIVDEKVKPIIDGEETANDIVGAGHRFNLTSYWVRHTITFKTLSSFNFNDDNAVYFRFDPATNAECYRELGICMPKLEIGMFATEFLDTYDDVRGKLGPLAFISGEWNAYNTYIRSDDLTPIVHHNDKYWYQRKNGSSKGDEPSDDSSVWRLAQSYDIILAKIIMASFGKIASAIFSGDFMISQYGKHNGVEVNEKSTKTEQDTAYTDFDDEDPDNGRFVPNLYLNFLTGLVRSVKMKAYDMEAHGGTFDNVKVSGTLNGVSGSFKKLSCLDSNGNEVGYISFSSDGRMWFYGDMQQQGADSKEHRAYRFLTNDVWCRGAFGHREKLIAWVCGTYMYVYPKGTDSNGTMISLDSAIIGKQTYYKIPLYSPKYESHSDVAGMPIDIVVFNCSTDYYYNFTGKGNGKEWTVINGNDAKTIHFADIGGWHELQGGHSLRCTYVPQKLLNPQSCKLGSGIGEGIFWTGDTDLNWL